MPRQSIWSARQRTAVFDLPTDEAALLRHYTLSDDDIEQIRVRRGGHNRLGFALQLCAFRYPGRLLAVGEGIPLNVLRFIAARLGMRAEDLGWLCGAGGDPEGTPRRIPVAKPPIAALAYDPAPYRSRPADGNAAAPTSWPTRSPANTGGQSADSTLAYDATPCRS